MRVETENCLVDGEIRLSCLGFRQIFLSNDRSIGYLPSLVLFESGSYGTNMFAHILAVLVIGLFAIAAATKHRRGKNAKPVKKELEIFAHYVAWQLVVENGSVQICAI